MGWNEPYGWKYRLLHIQRHVCLWWLASHVLNDGGVKGTRKVNAKGNLKKCICMIFSILSQILLITQKFTSSNIHLYCHYHFSVHSYECGVFYCVEPCRNAFFWCSCSGIYQIWASYFKGIPSYLVSHLILCGFEYRFQTFFDKFWGYLVAVVPVFVAFSTFGSLSIHIMTSAR